MPNIRAVVWLSAKGEDVWWRLSADEFLMNSRRDFPSVLQAGRHVKALAEQCGITIAQLWGPGGKLLETSDEG